MPNRDLQALSKVTTVWPNLLMRAVADPTKLFFAVKLACLLKIEYIHRYSKNEPS